jgi:hypothetical protein
MSTLVRIRGENSWNIDVLTFERDGESGKARCIERHGLGASPERLGEVYDDVRTIVGYTFKEQIAAREAAGAQVLDMFEYLKRTLARGGERR